MRTFWNDSEDQRGAIMTEYALMVTLIAVVCIGVVTALGFAVSALFSVAL